MSAWVLRLRSCWVTLIQVGNGLRAGHGCEGTSRLAMLAAEQHVDAVKCKRGCSAWFVAALTTSAVKGCPFERTALINCECCCSSVVKRIGEEVGFRLGRVTVEDMSHKVLYIMKLPGAVESARAEAAAAAAAAADALARQLIQAAASQPSG